MTPSPRVAVCLAAYNGTQWLDEQLDSILDQEGVQLVIFVSVDLSTDGTEALVDKRAKNESRIVVLPHGNKFGSAGRNFFRLLNEIDFADFDYISLSDQDDNWMSGKLIHAISRINKLNLDAYSSDVIAFWKNGKERLVKKSYPQKKFDHFFEAAGPGCTYVFKRSVAIAFQKFLRTNWEGVSKIVLHDWLLYAYSRQHKMRWLIDDQPLMRYRQHGGNQVGFNSGIMAYIKRAKLIRQQWYRNEVEKIISLVGGQSESEMHLNYAFLIRNYWELRRRPRDAFLLLLFVLTRIF